MKVVKDYTIAVLHDLIKTSKDEYFLLELASRKSSDAKLKSLFAVYAVEKKEHIIKLEAEIRRLGGNSETNKDDLEISIEFYESSFFEESQNGIIAECLKKDNLTILRYFDAIRKNIMWEVIPLVAKQYFECKSLHDQIKNICLERSERSINKIGVH